MRDLWVLGIGLCLVRNYVLPATGEEEVPEHGYEARNLQSGTKYRTTDLVSFASASAFCGGQNSYYDEHPNCHPSTVKEAVSCEALGTSVDTGSLYAPYGLHFNPLYSAYYGARMADALGYPNYPTFKCPTNRQFLASMDLATPWSGVNWTIAVDGAFGFNRNILRRCVAPDGTYPFLCTGSWGTPLTEGKNLGTLSYISLLHDQNNHTWTLFGQCWNAKTPEHPNRIETATSFNVFSLDPFLTSTDLGLITQKLSDIGFSTAASNLIIPDYTAISATP